MKTCPQCGRIYSDSVTVCSSCGTPLNGGMNNSAQNNDFQQPYQRSVQQYQQNQQPVQQYQQYQQPVQQYQQYQQPAQQYQQYQQPVSQGKPLNPKVINAVLGGTGALLVVFFGVLCGGLGVAGGYAALKSMEKKNNGAPLTVGQLVGTVAISVGISFAIPFTIGVVGGLLGIL